MPTRAQHARDEALRRLTRVNRSLTAAAVVGTAVLVEVVAQTPLGHAAAKRVLTTTGRAATNASAHTATVGWSVVPHHRSTPHHRLAASSAPTAQASGDDASNSSSSVNSSPPAASGASVSSSPPPASNPSPPPVVSSSPPVVVVSGGS